MRFVIFRNERIGAVAGAEFEGYKCVRCAPILRRWLLGIGDPKSAAHVRHAMKNYGWTWEVVEDPAGIGTEPE